jgi:hypothetical protein
MGLFAWGKLPSDPSKFWVDCAQAGAATRKIPRTKNQIPKRLWRNLALGIWFLEFARPTHVPMRMLRLLARVSAYFTLMERGDRIASAAFLSMGILSVKNQIEVECVERQNVHRLHARL